MVLTNILCVILYCVIHGSAFKLFDAEPVLGAQKPVVLRGIELENVLNLDGGGEYTTLRTLFDNQINVQKTLMKNDTYGRCQADHVRCLSSITLNNNAVCVQVNNTFRDFQTVCDLYLMICNYDTKDPNGADKPNLDFEIAGFGQCDNRTKTVYVYEPPI